MHFELFKIGATTAFPPTTEPRRIYVHYYFNIDKAADDEKAFDRQLVELRRGLESGKRVAEHESLYRRYFEIKTTPTRGTKVAVNADEVAKTKRYFGFFALVTNETMDAATALELYRNKDLVEKAFGNLKERLNMRRALVSSEQSLEGKLFVQFVALIFKAQAKSFELVNFWRSKRKSTKLWGLNHQPRYE